MRGFSFMNNNKNLSSSSKNAIEDMLSEYVVDKVEKNASKNFIDIKSKIFGDYLPFMDGKSSLISYVKKETAQTIKNNNDEIKDIISAYLGQDINTDDNTLCDYILEEINSSKDCVVKNIDNLSSGKKDVLEAITNQNNVISEKSNSIVKEIVANKTEIKSIVDDFESKALKQNEDIKAEISHQAEIEKNAADCNNRNFDNLNKNIETIDECVCDSNNYLKETLSTKIESIENDIIQMNNSVELSIKEVNDNLLSKEEETDKNVLQLIAQNKLLFKIASVALGCGAASAIATITTLILYFVK